MMNKSFIYPLVFITVLILSSCSSTKRLEKEVTIGNLSQKEYVGKIIDNGNRFKTISAKSVFTLYQDRKEPLSLSGSMRIYRGKVIQLSVSPIFGIEVARVEITPSGVLVLDRMKKRYVKVSFAELNIYLQNNLDYNSFEALFLNSIFVPGISTLTIDESKDFRVTREANTVDLSVDGKKQLDYNFSTSSLNGRLLQTNISLKGTPYKMQWKYDHFKALDGGEYPSLMSVNIDGTGKKIKLDIESTKLNTNADWQISTDIPQKYQKVGIEDIIKTLSK